MCTDKIVTAGRNLRGVEFKPCFSQKPAIGEKIPLQNNGVNFIKTVKLQNARRILQPRNSRQ